MNVATHARTVGNESEFVSEAAKIGFVPRVSVFVAVGSLDDDVVSLERVIRSGEQPVRTEAALDVRAKAAVVTVEVAMMSVAARTMTVTNAPAPRGSPAKSLDAVGMTLSIAVLSLEVAVMSLALAVRSVDLAVRDVSIARRSVDHPSWCRFCPVGARVGSARVRGVGRAGRRLCAGHRGSLAPGSRPALPSPLDAPPPRPRP
ncbi:MAG TPA: hypothetical protein VIY73_24815, partial [Polyangiaceae bacterium]